MSFQESAETVSTLVINIREKLRSYYETGKDIIVSLEDIPEYTLDDIFTVIYLVSTDKCGLYFDFDEDNYVSIDKSYNGDDDRIMYISDKIIDPVNFAILYMIYNYRGKNIDYIIDDLGCDVEISDKFLIMAKELGMVYYPLVQTMIDVFHIPFNMKEESMPEQIQRHLGLVSIKSARTRNHEL